MTTVQVPMPTRRVTPTTLPGRALQSDLLAVIDGEVRFDAGSISAYSTDASNYRYVPIGVVVPTSVEDGVRAVEVCRRHGAPLVSRGGGTSLAGQTTNRAVVIDWSKYVNRLVSVDVERHTCVVEPGIVLDHLNDELRTYELEFGPRPSTHSHCTIGGMIGNNSCGATAQRTGKVVDNIQRLEVLLYDGTRMWVGSTSDDEYGRIAAEGGRRAEIYEQLRSLRDAWADEIRARYPRIPRRVSGYNLDSLLPEKGFNLAEALVGSEGTLVTVLRAELKLVPTVRARTLVVVAYPDIASAADAVPRVLEHEPIALEGIDDRLISLERTKRLNQGSLDLLPRGGAWLMVQMGGDDRRDADRRAEAMLRGIGRWPDDPTVRYYDDPAEERELWEVREAGLGATARMPGSRDAWPGWEDSAVAPERLGAYLRELHRLFDEFGLDDVSVYGHFGQGCVHCRIPFDLFTAAGVHAFRAFLERAADLVVAYGGSLTGEHGDGQARSELLGKMFGADLLEAFAQFKAVFDPDGLMNPGKVVHPRRLDAGLRLGTEYRHVAGDTWFRYPSDEGNFARAVLRCVGVGKCRRESGGVMCPSFMVTREEEHSTRGRARLLFEMLDGTARHGAVADGWRSEAVRDALDLCLMCKGCRSDCPVNVDMATYKAEFLAHHYAGRIRPRAHYSMGWLPAWAAIGAFAAPVVNQLAQTRGIDDLLKRVAGVDRRRNIPQLATTSFQRWFRSRKPGGDGRRGDVLLWPDTFTNRFEPSIARSAVTVLEQAGWRVHVPRERVCCGLTWISTGQLAIATRVLQRTVRILREPLRNGTKVVGLEPSCTAVFRSDATELFPHDDDVARLRGQVVTFAELLHDHSAGWEPPYVGGRALVQTHCHQHAILGNDADRALLASAGCDVDVLDSGCCGLAGNFGFEEGHYDVSKACAERVLLPAVRAAGDDDVVLADGFSCRTQLAQLDSGGRRGRHLAEVLADALVRSDRSR